jgi:protocatechuate 3,4-dioxygenase beta subunit
MRLHLLMAMLAMMPLQAPPTSQNAGASALKDGVIEVTVRDSATKEPIPGARVTFIFQQSPPPNIVTYVNADQSGHATFRDLAAGTYSVNAQRDGYINNIQATFNQSMKITADKKTFSVDVTLTRGATLAGHVLDPNGVPIARADITLAAMSYRNGRPTIARAGLTGSSQTNDRGEYRLIGLAPGDYYVQVDLRPGGEQLVTGVWDDFPRVTFYPGVVDPKRAAKITIGGSQDLASIDMKIPVVTSYKISGSVINSVPGGRTFNGQVNREIGSYYLGSTDTDSLQDPILIESRLTPSKNPEESIFEISGIMPGTWYLYPIFDTGAGSLSFITARTPVTVVDHDVDGLRIVLKPNSEIKGRFVVDGNAAAVPLEMVRISLRPKDRVPTLLGGAAGGISVNSDAATGEFTLTNVPDARFGVIVTGLPPTAYVSDVRQAGRSVFNDGMIPDSAQPLEVEIRTNSASIQGTVHSAAGEAAVRSAVVLIPAARQNSQLYKRATTDMNGVFRLTGIAPGQYKIFAWSSPPLGQAEENAEYIAPFENRGTLVNVMAGASMPVSLTVIPLP